MNTGSPDWPQAFPGPGQCLQASGAREARMWGRLLILCERRSLCKKLVMPLSSSSKSWGCCYDCVLYCFALFLRFQEL